MNKGDVSLNNKLSVIKKSIRTAIASSFNTLEMIKMFGAQDLSELEKQLMHIDEDFRLKKITKEDMEFKKVFELFLDLNPFFLILFFLFLE